MGSISAGEEYRTQTACNQVFCLHHKKKCRHWSLCMCTYLMSRRFFHRLQDHLRGSSFLKGVARKAHKVWSQAVAEKMALRDRFLWHSGYCLSPRVFCQKVLRQGLRFCSSEHFFPVIWSKWEAILSHKEETWHTQRAKSALAHLDHETEFVHFDLLL